jgi:hypothetical protein
VKVLNLLFFVVKPAKKANIKVCQEIQHKEEELFRKASLRAFTPTSNCKVAKFFSVEFLFNHLRHVRNAHWGDKLGDFFFDANVYVEVVQLTKMETLLV